MLKDFIDKTKSTELYIEIKIISLSFFNLLTRCKRIKMLDLFLNNNTDLLSNHFLSISNLLNLKYLTIFNCKLTDDAIEFLIKIIELSKSAISIRICNTEDDLNEALVFNIFEYNLNNENYLNFGIERLIGLDNENDLFNNINFSNKIDLFEFLNYVKINLSIPKFK